MFPRFPSQTDPDSALTQAARMLNRDEVTADSEPETIADELKRLEQEYIDNEQTLKLLNGRRQQAMNKRLSLDVRMNELNALMCAKPLRID